MTGEGRTVDIGKYRLLEMRRHLLLIVVAGVVVWLWAASPTWGSFGLALVLIVVGVAMTALPAIAFGAAGRKPPRAVLALFPVVMFELLRVGLVTWAALDAAEAAWMGLWTAFVMSAGMLVTVKASFHLNAADPDGKDMTREHPGPLLAPRRLLRDVAGICHDVACCLLVAWSPWLVLVTIAQGSAEGLLKDDSTGQTWVKIVGGFALLTLALFLWLRMSA
ncbi:hypothetical protein [Nonomuraea sp. GTA35]|uniref:hypothetical protein n=1 Tax=Nonomuraea sp. GTA35 TaxID=1676746 RepID=UPI0035C21466